MRSASSSSTCAAAAASVLTSTAELMSTAGAGLAPKALAGEVTTAAPVPTCVCAATYARKAFTRDAASPLATAAATKLPTAAAEL